MTTIYVIHGEHGYLGFNNDRYYSNSNLSAAVMFSTPEEAQSVCDDRWTVILLGNPKIKVWEIAERDFTDEEKIG